MFSLMVLMTKVSVYICFKGRTLQAYLSQGKGDTALVCPELHHLVLSPELAFMALFVSVKEKARRKNIRERQWSIARQRQGG
jgi:hypothetical protein